MVAFLLRPQACAGTVCSGHQWKGRVPACPKDMATGVFGVIVDAKRWSEVGDGARAYDTERVTTA
ncbi:hypothetical protein GCM10018793_41630 [Streptomyces sulfonofaciens]|uniref:Uncharacterized protein n=1 Tax=Streptomyces sulfonofaciens TaxID=68272 RepID=A0A919L2A3_9ACTN|nr:hypothetical protein GCM10018793_41630 [Streptomyces sulfonofaciens]